MSANPPTLDARLEAVGRRLGAREAAHAADLAAARDLAALLHGRVAAALDAFHAGARAAGAPHLGVTLEEARLDDKHVRSVQFALERGRTRALVTVKSHGAVTLVGPFKTGKDEGPCQSFPSDSRGDIDAALGDLLEGFLEAAVTP